MRCGARGRHALADMRAQLGVVAQVPQQICDHHAKLRANVTVLAPVHQWAILPGIPCCHGHACCQTTATYRRGRMRRLTQNTYVPPDEGRWRRGRPTSPALCKNNTWKHTGTCESQEKHWAGSDTHMANLGTKGSIPPPSCNPPSTQTSTWNPPWTPNGADPASGGSQGDRGRSTKDATTKRNEEPR